MVSKHPSTNYPNWIDFKDFAYSSTLHFAYSLTPHFAYCLDQSVTLFGKYFLVTLDGNFSDWFRSIKVTSKPTPLVL
jgi:hypothetical protein